jgi:hypothetical protein
VRACKPFNFISSTCLIASSSLAKAKANDDYDDDNYDDDDDDDDDDYDCGAFPVRWQDLSCMCSSMRISANGLTRATSVLCHTPLNLQAQTANNKITK